MVELDIIRKNKSWYSDVTDSGNFTDSVWTSLWVFDSLMRLLWSLLMLLFSFNTWLSDFNYSRQPSLSEIPAQHLTVNSERRTNSVTDSPQSSTLLKCLCLNKAWLLYSLVQSQTHSQPLHLLLQGKFPSCYFHSPLMKLKFDFVNFVLMRRKIKLVLSSLRLKEDKIIILKLILICLKTHIGKLEIRKLIEK